MAQDDVMVNWLWERFGSRKGFLVDVGAVHGWRGYCLTTELLQDALWSGILIEPLPEFIAELRKLYGDRTDIQIVDKAASNVSGESLFYPFKGVSTLEEEYAKVCEAWWKHIKYKTPFKVRIDPLSVILEECNAPKKIDLLQIDAEGHDFKVLQGMDWEKYDVDVLVVETADVRVRATNGVWPPPKEWVDFLSPHGFVLNLMTKGGNVLFVREEK